MRWFCISWISGICDSVFLSFCVSGALSWCSKQKIRSYPSLVFVNLCVTQCTGSCIRSSQWSNRSTILYLWSSIVYLIILNQFPQIMIQIVNVPLVSGRHFSLFSKLPRRTAASIRLSFDFNNLVVSKTFAFWKLVPPVVRQWIGCAHELMSR